MIGSAFDEVAGHTFPELYAMRVAASPDQPAVHQQHDGEWRPWTWSELKHAADALTAALIDLGVSAGDHVALMTAPRVEGLIATWATQAMGAVPCAVYANTDGETLSYLIKLTAAKVLVVEDETFLDRALAADPRIPLDTVIVLNDAVTSGADGPDRHNWSASLERGAAVVAETGDVGTAAAAAGSPADPCAVYFTSGTTARPKAVVLSHRNILSSYFAPFGDGHGQLPQPGAADRTLHDIPLGSVAGAVFALFYPLVYGCSTYIPAESSDALAVLREVRPTVFLAFPRTWEQLSAEILAGLDRGSSVQAALDGVGLGEIKYALAGGLPVAAVRQWREWGIVVRGIYGMNETGGLATMQTGRSPKAGTSGAALPGMELILDMDGEILVRGPGVFSGYMGNAEATADALDPDGWLHTGDIGQLDSDGELRVVDRKNDIILLASGVTVATSDVAGALKHSRYIRDALVVGTERSFPGALLEPDLAALRVWANREGVPSDSDQALLADPRTQALFRAEVGEANTRLADQGKPAIGGFRVLPRELNSADPTEVTATRKLRRQHLALKFSDLIDDLFATSAE